MGSIETQTERKEKMFLRRGEAMQIGAQSGLWSTG